MFALLALALTKFALAWVTTKPAGTLRIKVTVPTAIVRIRVEVFNDDFATAEEFDTRDGVLNYWRDYRGLPEGEYDVISRARNAAGEISQTPALHVRVK